MPVLPPLRTPMVSPEDKLKYLGILLDKKFSWKPYVQKVKTQLSSLWSSVQT